jgi:hypothetical protein
VHLRRRRTDPVEIVATLGAHVDTSAFSASKQLEVIRASDMYLRSGGFSADEVIGSWKAAMSDVMYDGRFDVVRAVETWSLRDDWLELARKVDWTPRYVDERELFPEELSGHPWLTHDAWRG